MAETLNEIIVKLRKKSRALLSRVDEKSKRVDAEVKKLHLSTLSPCHNRRNNHSCCAKNVNLKLMRHEPCEVSASSCPNYSSPYTMSSGKLTLTSKKAAQPCTIATAPRKPVKDCYCHAEVSAKSHVKSAKSQQKRVSPCRPCKSHPDLGNIREIDLALNSPISCETFRRIQRIDYAPKSQFLRNVQNKICELSNVQADHSRMNLHPRSSTYHHKVADTKTLSADERAAMADEHKQQLDDKQTSCTFPRTPANSLVSEQSDMNIISSEEMFQVSAQKPAKSKLRKISLSSMKRKPNASEQSMFELADRSKQEMQPIRKDPHAHYYRDLVEAMPSGDPYREMDDLPRYEHGSRSFRHDNSTTAMNDQEVADLKKFRERNYLETHGSSHTLASSGSSLQQYLLNERLFAEPAGRIHKQDLVVTMPPCVTKQMKRVHYFPRYVVPQERSIPLNQKRKRCQSCPLTGHTIDLGILLAKPPLNSLALKYQKRVS